MSYVQHGHRHGPKGSDPSPANGLQYNSGTYGPINQGDHLDVYTDTYMYLQANDSVQLLNSGSEGTLIQDSGAGGLTLAATSGVITVHNSGSGGINLLSDGAGVAVLTLFPIILSASGGTNEATVQVRLSASNYFMVMDQTPTPRFMVDAAGNVAMLSLPTSSAGLASGFLWNSGGTVKIV